VTGPVKFYAVRLRPIRSRDQNSLSRNMACAWHSSRESAKYFQAPPRGGIILRNSQAGGSIHSDMPPASAGALLATYSVGGLRSGVRFRRAPGFRGPPTAPEFQSAKAKPHTRVRRRPQSLRADRWQILSGPGGEIVRRRSAVSAQGCHADKVRTPTKQLSGHAKHIRDNSTLKT
jgi:hypothetical protein